MLGRENGLERRSLGGASARMGATGAFDGEAKGFVVPLEGKERGRGNSVLGDELGVVHGVEILVDELEDSMLQFAD